MPASADAEELWVSVDDFANEIIRWFLEVMVDGHTIAITRGGTVIAYMVPVEKWDVANGRLLAPSAHTDSDTASDAGQENRSR